ncbi:MAG: ATP-dependent DNA helicase RecG, partial [Halieaceae bacterium]
MTGIVPQKLETLRGVGPKLAARLQDYGIGTVEDLLFHLPLRYQDRTRITPIGALQDGAEAVIEGEIALVSLSGGGRRRSLTVSLQDGTGTASLRFFHFSNAQRNALQQGDRLRCFGTVRRGVRQQPELVHPEYRRGTDLQATESALTPIYPGTEGISQNQWRRLCEQALSLLASNPPRELLPDGSQHYGLLSALEFLHQPPPDADQLLLREGRHPAQLRLALEELIAHQLSMRELRALQRSKPAPVLRDEHALSERFLARLPFSPTGAQERVNREVGHDLAQSKPMLRLVQGDVGSGKTLVAAAAALIAIASGYQVAVMAPTELLAEQHRHNFASWFETLDIAQSWLAGSVKGQQRQRVLEGIADGSAALVIGTHALFQEGVVFARLGLVIVDEQHRFGVHQRLSLSEKSGGDWRAHQLIMTATPIPRTLSMVAYADLDCSVIDELPPGRQPVETVLVDNQRRAEVVERVAHA